MNDYETNENRFIGQYTYDKSNNVTRVRTVADGTQLTVSYAYTKENIPLSTTMNSSVAYSYSYDKLNRMTKTALSTPNEVELNYTYLYSARNAENETLYKTTQLHTEDLALQTYRYTYDKLGNITEIEEKAAGETSYSSKVSYTYDPLGQLTRENNVDLNKTIVYNYDEGGNITSKVEYPYTTGTVGEETNTITYGYTNKNGYWGDKLRSITVGETTQSFTYDDIGNPLTYRDGMSFTWQGRQMTSANVNGTEISYKYDADGLRSYKKVGSTVHEYEYLGGKLVYEKRGDVQLRFRYDAMGNLAGITRINPDGAVYKVYVICNSRGDVEQLRKADGTVFATYKYDTWGNMIGVYNASGAAITSETNLANQNPIRYRGYYYDAETGLYYLQSRYYDAQTGRFVSADGQISGVGGEVLGYNLYAYCFNNPVNASDNSGNWPNWGAVAKKIAIGAGAILIGAAVVAATAATGGAAAVFVGAVATGVKAAALSGAIGAVVGAGASAISHRVTTGSWKGSGKAAAEGAVDGFADGFMTGGITAGAGMAIGAIGKTSSGIQIGKTAKPQYGKVNVGYGTPKTNGSTLLSIQNNAGKRIFSFDLDAVHAVHAHLPKVFPGKHIPIGSMLSGTYSGVIQW